MPSRAAAPVSGRLRRRHKVRLAVEILTAYARLRLAMRSGDIEAIVASERRRRRPWISPPADSRQLAGAVLGLLAVLPTDSRCLIQALVLLSLLERREIACELVIGVRTEPSFLGHAWIVCAGEELLPALDGEFAPLTTI